MYEQVLVDVLLGFAIGVSLGLTTLFLAVCVGIVAWIFRTGWKLRS